MTACAPAISVVIPTYNRSELLPGLVAALNAQTGLDSYEVIFVDNGSTDETLPTLERLVDEARFPMRILHTENRANPAPARNLGWRAARAPLVAFTDDDCLPAPGWLAALVEALAHADIVQGRTEAPEAELANRGPFARVVMVLEFTWKFETCNVAYRRELIERLGGFDEGLPVVFGEDIDLGWRGLALGASTAWAPEAVVLHRVDRRDSRIEEWIGMLRYARRCELAATIIKRYPGFREHLFLRCFYQPYHAAALIAIAGLAIAPRRPLLGATGLAPWLYYRMIVDRRPGRARWLWAVLPMAFAVDIAELGSTVKGSLRSRSLLL